MDKLYGIILIGLIAALSLLYVYYRPKFFEPISPYHAPLKQLEISETWTDFQKDCGGEVIVENFIHARSIFNKKYENNVIEWTGYFVERKELTSSNNLKPLPFNYLEDKQ